MDALDFAFQFFERYRLHQLGRFDRDVRQPALVMKLAADRGWLPEPSRTVLVSGSKGKGSVCRLIAWNLTHVASGPVGLLVSPEELNHLDRIRIDNIPISSFEFSSIIEDISADLQALQDRAPQNYYIPPTAVFLLVALAWWRRHGVKWFVVEGGRGVKYDEIGQLDGAVGVLTSILPEHMDRLGPRIEDIAIDKLTLVHRVQRLICGPTASTWAYKLLDYPVSDRIKAVDVDYMARSDGYSVDVLYRLSLRLAQSACSELLGHSFEPIAWVAPSFFRQRFEFVGDGRICDCDVLLDGAVSVECVVARLADVSLRHPLAIVLGLSDDKDVYSLVEFFGYSNEWSIYTVYLTSPLGHICSSWVASTNFIELGELDVISGADSRLSEKWIGLVESHKTVVFIGVQTFLRAVRRTLRIPLMGPSLSGLVLGNDY